MISIILTLVLASGTVSQSQYASTEDCLREAALFVDSGLAQEASCGMEGGAQ